MDEDLSLFARFVSELFIKALFDVILRAPCIIHTTYTHKHTHTHIHTATDHTHTHTHTHTHITLTHTHKPQHTRTHNTHTHTHNNTNNNNNNNPDNNTSDLRTQDAESTPRNLNTREPIISTHHALKPNPEGLGLNPKP